jgi:MFS family permease
MGARGRYRILSLLCFLAMITYLDRVCFGTAAGDIAVDLKLPRETVIKWASTAFALSYAFFEIPSGWIGDVFGPRKTLIRIVLVWSVCTAATGFVGWGTTAAVGLGFLTAVRFLFGAGEAGAFPNITRALHNWFPSREWATAQGFIWMSGRIMGGLTPMIWWLLVVPNPQGEAFLSWRGAFFLFGVMGLVWCAVFATWFRNHPVECEDSPETPQEASSHAVPWRQFLSSGNMWAICLMYFGTAYGWYFNITYLPTFLKTRYGMADSSQLGAIYKGGPLWIGAAGCLLGGVLADQLARRWSRRRARRSIGVTGHSLSALCWLAAAFAPNAHVFFVLVSLTAFFNDLTLASAWSTCQDVGQRFSAVASAWMNTVGTLGAAAAGWLTGWLVEQAVLAQSVQSGIAAASLAPSQRTAAELIGYEHSFYTYAGMYAVTAAMWLLIDTERPIVPLRNAER